MQGTEEPRTGLHYIPFHLSRHHRRSDKKGIDGERIVDVHNIDQWILLRR